MKRNVPMAKTMPDTHFCHHRSIPYDPYVSWTQFIVVARDMENSHHRRAVMCHQAGVVVQVRKIVIITSYTGSRCNILLMSHEIDHMTKAAAWATGSGFWLLWARPKPVLGRHQWPGPNRLGLAWLMALGRARQITSNTIGFVLKNGNPITIIM